MHIPRLAVLLLATGLALSAQAQSSFTYQGRLTESGSGPTGLYDFEFRLYSANSGGLQIGSVLAREDIGVTNGLFSVSLDFGPSAFPGADRFLAIAVRPGASAASHTVLSPRQAVTTTPYAITAANFGGTVGAAQLSGSYSGAVSFDNPGNSFIGSGAGLTDVNASQLNGQPAAFFQIADHLTGTLPASAVGDNSIAAAKLANDSAGLTKVSGGNATVSGANIGIGTPTPGAKLDVRGDIKLGPAGEFFASSSTDNLRIVRGIVTPTGTIYNGTGFTITKKATGSYSIAFNPPFADAPALILTAYTAAAPVTINCTGGSGTGFSDISTWLGATKTDSWFNLIAIGAR